MAWKYDTIEDGQRLYVAALTEPEHASANRELLELVMQDYAEATRDGDIAQAMETLSDLASRIDDGGLHLTIVDHFAAIAQALAETEATA